MDKPQVLAAIIAQLTQELAQQTRAALASREDATSPENKAENQYDMRGQEAAYLAEGQARLAAELAESLQLYRTLDLANAKPGGGVTLGSLVTLEGMGAPTHYFFGPRHGGLEVQVDGQSVLVVTPASPLGRQLQGRKLGAVLQLPGRRGPILHRITALIE